MRMKIVKMERVFMVMTCEERGSNPKEQGRGRKKLKYLFVLVFLRYEE
jgi:hypothetical protein